jgi:hypothetical protein
MLARTSPSKQSQREFLQKLTKTAQWQSQLQRERLLPVELDALTSLIGNYPWQTLLIISGLTAATWSLWGAFIK